MPFWRHLQLADSCTHSSQYSYRQLISFCLGTPGCFKISLDLQHFSQSDVLVNAAFLYDSLPRLFILAILVSKGPSLKYCSGRLDDLSNLAVLAREVFFCQRLPQAWDPPFFSTLLFPHELALTTICARPCAESQPIILLSISMYRYYLYTVFYVAFS